MLDETALAQRFQAHRPHLLAVAQRLLGSSVEAEDAVQEAWLRLQRAEVPGAITNLGGWLTTVVSRVCLDALRTRRARGEQFCAALPEQPQDGVGPEHEAVLSDAVGAALLVVLDTLAPAERLAFVLHDVFAVPFADIAAVLGRSPAATRQLASRARRRVQDGASRGHGAAGTSARREVVEAFLAAARDGDFEGLLSVLHPEVVLRADSPVPYLGGVDRLAGRNAVARAFLGTMRAASGALLDGCPGAVFTSGARLRGAVEFGVTAEGITAIDVVSDTAVLEGLDVVPLDA